MIDAADLLARYGIKLASTAPGRHYAVCPQCSASRSKEHRTAKCLGITIEPGGSVRWGCNHCNWTGPEKGHHKPNGRGEDDFAAIYDYPDAGGVVRFQKVRNLPGRAPKFWMRRPDGKSGWINGSEGLNTDLLYRLPEIVEAIALGRMVVVAEGEKDVDNLWRIGIPATCNVHGAHDPTKNQKPKWKAAHSEQLRGADIVILNDNDAAGRAHAEAVARLSLGIASRVRYLDLALHWPGMPANADVSNWLAVGHSRKELDALIANAPEFASVDISAPPAARSIKRLQTMTFEPIKYVVPGVIVEGLTIIAGKPKLGKSWLMFHAAIAVASGEFTLGKIQCAQGDVLYCALEDSERRLQSRMTKLCGFARPWPERMSYFCLGEVPRLNAGGIDMIREWIRSVPEPRLIVIDTFATVRAPKKNGEPAYDADYESGKALQALANEYGVAIVIVHHLRKLEADDVFDTVSGTLGLTGVVDTILVLKRNPGGGTTLHGRGRDLEAFEKAIIWNADSCTWTLVGDAKMVRRSSERVAILEALASAGEPLTPSDIAGSAGMKATNVKKLLRKMLDADEVEKLAYGSYRLARRARVIDEAAE
jgi:hypothetical protein